MTIKEQIKKLMEQKGMSVRELSEKSGVPKPTIYAIIRRNSSSVTHATAVKLSEALECTPADIYGFDPEGAAEYNNLFNKFKEIQEEIRKEKDDPDNWIDEALPDGSHVKKQIFEDPALQEILGSIDARLTDLLEFYGVAHGRPNKYAPIISYYNELNEEGQLELIKRAEELTQLPKYKK